MPATLDTLPPELLNGILEIINEDDEQGTTRLGTLRALCRTSRYIKDAATPYLYQRLRLYEPGEEVFLLARSLSENPTLAKHVQHGVFKANECKPINPLPEELFQAVDSTSLIKKFEQMESFKISMKCGCYTLPIARVLSLATQLRSLEVQLAGDMERERPDVEETDSSVESTPCCSLAHWLMGIFANDVNREQYKRLVNVQLSGNGVHGIHAAIEMMKLPSLQVVTLKGFGCIVPLNSTAGIAVSNVASLYLNECFFLAEDIMGMIRSCKKLKELHVEYDIEVTGLADWVPSPEINLTMLMGGLQEHSKTLESLCLTDQWGSDELICSSIPNFSAFTALRYLEVDISILVGDQMWAFAALQLPPNLTELAVHTDAELGNAQGICECLSRVSHENLERVSLTFPGEEDCNEEWKDASFRVKFLEETDGPETLTGRAWESGLHTFDLDGLVLWWSGEDVLAVIRAWTRLVEEHGVSGLLQRALCGNKFCLTKTGQSTWT